MWVTVSSQNTGLFVYNSLLPCIVNYSFALVFSSANLLVNNDDNKTKINGEISKIVEILNM